MGRIWKFTEQVYEEIGENVDKKLETQFKGDIFMGGAYGIYANPFEDCAEQVNTGMNKMDSYVELINDANGYTRTKLDNVFTNIADSDKSFGNKIDVSTDNLERYKKMLYKLEEVMNSALSASSYGNAKFKFNRNAFQADMVEIDKEYVDSVLSRDTSELTEEDYHSIAVVIGRQPVNNTDLVEHILESAYCWSVKDCCLSDEQIKDLEEVDWNEVDPNNNGKWSVGRLEATDKYNNLMAALSKYALNLVQGIEKPYSSGNVDLTNASRYEQMFRGILEVTLGDFEFEYDLTGDDEALQERLRDIFELKTGNTSINVSGNKDNVIGNVDGLLVTIGNGTLGINEIKLDIIEYTSQDSLANILNGLQNCYINDYLGLDNSPGEVFKDKIISGIIKKFGNDFKKEFFGSGATTIFNIMSGAAIAALQQETKQKTVREYQEIGTLVSTINLLKLKCGVISKNNAGALKEEIVVCPTKETQERLDKINDFLINEVNHLLDYRKKNVQDEKTREEIDKLKDSIAEMTGSGGITMDYIRKNLYEVDSIFDMIGNQINQINHKNYSPKSLAEAVDYYETKGAFKWEE